MASDKINYIPLDKLMSYAIHGPHIKVSQEQAEINKAAGLNDYFPLYARSDKKGYDKRSSKWLAAVEKTYNSPRNVRALCISRGEVHIQYWSTGKGTLNSLSDLKILERTPSSALGINPTNIHSVLTAAIISNLGNPIPECLNLENSWVSKNSFGAFTSDWSLSNLEELYFDASMLIGLPKGTLRKLSNAGFVATQSQDKDGNVLYNPIKIAELNSPLNTNVSKWAKELASLFYLVVKAGLAGNTTQEGVGIPGYPRLKFIGYIFSDPTSGLGPAGLGMGPLPNISIPKDSLESNKISERISDYNRRGSQYLMRNTFEAKQKGNPVSGIFIDTGVNLFKAPFSTNKVWKFDEDYLIDTFSKLEENLKAVEFLQRGKSFADLACNKDTLIGEEAPATKSLTPEHPLPKPEPKVITAETLNEGVTNELEKQLNTLLTNKKIKLARTALTNIRDLKGEKALQETLAEFSAEGQTRYKKLLSQQQKV